MCEQYKHLHSRLSEMSSRTSLPERSSARLLGNALSGWTPCPSWREGQHCALNNFLCSSSSRTTSTSTASFSWEAEVQTRKCGSKATLLTVLNTIKPKLFNISLTSLTSVIEQHQRPLPITSYPGLRVKMISYGVSSTVRFHLGRLRPARSRLKINQLASLGRRLTVRFCRKRFLFNSHACKFPVFNTWMQRAEHMEGNFNVVG